VDDPTDEGYRGDLDGVANSQHGRALVQLCLGRVAEARATIATVLVASADLGERRSRAHFLDSAAMIALVEGDLDGAWRFLPEAAEAAAGMAEPLLLAGIALHRALAALSAATSRLLSGMLIWPPSRSPEVGPESARAPWTRWP